jgi:hypothetical protein
MLHVVVGAPIPLWDGQCVAVENATASMLDHKETVQLPEQQRRHCEQIESDDHLAMIPQESQPTVCAILATTHAPEIP